MNKYIALFLLLILIGCSNEQSKSDKESTTQEPPMATHILLDQSKAPFTSLSAHGAEELISTKTDILILDTRTTSEIRSQGAIAGSKQADLRAIFKDQLAIPKDKPILVVCAVGGRSYAASKIMIKHGFQEIYNLRGGLDEWKASGLPVIYPK